MPTAEDLLKPQTAGVDENIKHRAPANNQTPLWPAYQAFAWIGHRQFSKATCATTETQRAMIIKLGKVGHRLYLIRTKDGKLCHQNRKILYDPQFW